MSDWPMLVVGYEWHEFYGPGERCLGFLGSPAGQVCNMEKDAYIHSDDCKPDWIKDKEMKDSGQRTEYSNGMVREVSDKPAFHLLLPRDIPYDEQMLTRFATLMQKGAKKYAPRNWELGVGEAELERAKESAHRHMMQYLCGETDEDHAAAVFFNIMQAEYIRYKLERMKSEA